MVRPGRDGNKPTQVRSSRRSSPGAVADSLQVWVQIGPNNFQLYLHDESAMVSGPDGDRPMSLENGPNVHLMVPNRKFVIDLTFMTHDEHAAFRKFINMALDLSEPVVLLRDKEAQDAFDAGDDSFHRLHRAIPNMVVRPRAERAYREIVRLGLADVLAGGWTLLGEYLGTRGRRNVLADPAPPEAGSKDDAASPDQS